MLTKTMAVPVQLTRDLPTVPLSSQETCCHVHIRDCEFVGSLRTGNCILISGQIQPDDRINVHVNPPPAPRSPLQAG
jgi:hypothetical protein